MSLYIKYSQMLSSSPYRYNELVRVRSEEDLSGMSASAMLRVPCQCEVMLSVPGEMEEWVLPLDPVVAISCKNKIVKREVLKVHRIDKERRGTVKELWTQGDYEIDISGVLMSEKEGDLPEEELRRLRAFCEHRGSIQVYSPLFTIFNIKKICIEDYSFPFTKGMTNQMYSIKATSDDFETSNLLIAK